MSALTDRLDEIGWSDKWPFRVGLMFGWMAAATDRIEQLTAQVERPTIEQRRLAKFVYAPMPDDGRGGEG